MEDVVLVRGQVFGSIKKFFQPARVVKSGFVLDPKINALWSYLSFSLYPQK